MKNNFQVGFYDVNKTKIPEAFNRYQVEPFRGLFFGVCYLRCWVWEYGEGQSLSVLMVYSESHESVIGNVTVATVFIPLLLK